MECEDDVKQEQQRLIEAQEALDARNEFLRNKKEAFKLEQEELDKLQKKERFADYDDFKQKPKAERAILLSLL